MVFADTNIVVYSYGADPAKVSVAESIIKAAPVISTQVIGEFHNVARRKLELDMATRHRVATDPCTRKTCTTGRSSKAD